MCLLDFLNTPKWKSAQTNTPDLLKIRKIEEDYWWIDENEPKENIVEPDAFYEKCLQTFINISRENSLRVSAETCAELLPVGEKVVFEYLYDRYLVQRHESDPDIFYSYVLQLSFEAGITIASKWKDGSEDLENFIDVIIRETSMDYIKEIYTKDFEIDTEYAWSSFISKLSFPMYDLLKWYHQADNFEDYKLRLLLAAFVAGALLSNK